MTTNVIVDLKQELLDEYRGQLVGEIGEAPGVRRAQTSPRAPRMVLVDYDPEITDSRTILNIVARHGLDARLVGM